MSADRGLQYAGAELGMAAGGGTLNELADRLEARVIVPAASGQDGYCDMCVATTISEALRDASPGCALVIPLGNAQVVRAASLLSAAAVVVCAGAEIEPEAVAQARQSDVALLETVVDVESCRRLRAGAQGAAGLSGAVPRHLGSDELAPMATFPVLGAGYLMAGRASQKVREALEAAGVCADVVRRVSIATYEAEMNVVIYAPSGSVSLAVTPAEVQVCVSDNGPGIEDLERAMRPGYSTAPAKARAMGFGAGMGLPNIARCCDELSIQTGPRESGTRVVMRFRRHAPTATGDTT
jgi:serine/threonine-protein kinase RsbT